MADIINNNIYGGAIIPSSFVFDFVHYGSYSTLNGNKDWESMAIGRHCLIKYCNYAFTTGERTELESYKPDAEGNKTYPIDATQQQKDYIDAFVADGNRSYDGLVVQKTKDGPLMIGYTNHGLSTEYADSQFAEDFKKALDGINNATRNLEKAVTDVNTLSEKMNETDETINQIEQDITDTNTKVESNSTEIETLKEQVSSVQNTINEDLTQHIEDFNSRTTWDEEKGITLSLGTELPKEDTPGRLSVIGDNIYYNQQVLSRGSWFKEAETAGAKYGAFPQVWVDGVTEEELKNIPVKIYIGPNPPVSTVNDITIWIKT